MRRYFFAGSPAFVPWLGAGLPSGALFSVYGGAPDAAVPTFDCCEPALPVFSFAPTAWRVSASAAFGVGSPAGGGVVGWAVVADDAECAAGVEVAAASSRLPQPDTTDDPSAIARVVPRSQRGVVVMSVLVEVAGAGHALGMIAVVPTVGRDRIEASASDDTSTDEGDETMKVCVVGAGAIGGLLAFRLASAGHAVSVVARGAHRDAIVAHGLTLVDHLDGGRRSSVPIRVSDDPAPLGVQDVVFIGLKAHAIPALLPAVATMIGPTTMLVPAINGVPWWYFQREGGPHDGLVVKSVDPAGTMHATVAASSIVGCVVHAAGEVREPGVVHHTGGREFIVGEIDRTRADPRSDRVVALAEALRDARLEPTVSTDIRKDVWTKLVGNLSFNPVAALTYAHMGRLCASAGLLDVIRPMLVEGMAVAAAYGVDIAMNPDQRIDLARKLGAARISMHQDFEAGRMPEIDAIVGAVIELAERVGVAMPVTRMVCTLLRERAISDGLIAG